MSNRNVNKVYGSSKDRLQQQYANISPTNVSKAIQNICPKERRAVLSRCRELFKQALESLGYDAKNYGLHSLRAGGITSVVQNSNNTVPERLLKLHGRWKTDAAKDMYIQETVNKRLQVTEHLGL